VVGAAVADASVYYRCNDTAQRKVDARSVATHLRATTGKRTFVIIRWIMVDVQSTAVWRTSCT